MVLETQQGNLCFPSVFQMATRWGYCSMDSDLSIHYKTIESLLHAHPCGITSMNKTGLVKTERLIVREKADCGIDFSWGDMSLQVGSNNTSNYDFTKIQIGGFIRPSYRAYVRCHLQESRWHSSSCIFTSSNLHHGGDLMEVASWCPAFSRPFTCAYSLSPPKITFSCRRNSWNPR